MELLIVGTLDGQIGAASKIAISQGGQVSLAQDIDAALNILRSGKSIELVMIDVKLDVYKFISSLESERINVLVVACGVANDPTLAVKAIKAGAKEYIPLPPDPELIGAVLAAATRARLCRKPCRTPSTSASSWEAAIKISTKIAIKNDSYVN